MSSQTTIQRLLERHDRGEYFSSLVHAPVPHRLRERPVVAFHAVRNSLEPRFTTVMPTFNHAPIVQEVLRALVARASQPFDCIVVDDGSQDDTVERVRGFFESGDTSPVARATIWRSPVPIFETACDNLGFALSETEVIVELQADIENHAFDELRATKRGSPEFHRFLATLGETSVPEAAPLA